MKRIVLTLITILLVASATIAQIIHIASDYPTIQAGIDAAEDGDTLTLNRGELPSGLYFLKVYGDETLVMKVLID